MARSKSSGRWLKEHFDDPYVKQSQKDGYRSRASYKLLEIQEKDRILRPGMSLVDLGAAPGGWCQVAAQILGDRGRIVASDILPMDPLADVTFVQGDFTEEAVLEEILRAIGSEQVDLVISDMAPNMSGMTAVDQPRAMYLAELALDMARQVLKPGGTFLTKVFQGAGFDEYFRDLRGSFERLQSRKPNASRPRSREIYLLARGFKG
ncbi:23S rRNA (uridine(2552)-2'-O)-methyltransferase RlmE [Aestuariirhabdus litorea]|uniref:Ribosomal RNA large subunit methyltransferase E n=1 Tax=Aestuariirhabdus litorea TaxID=2528527 RepID=A0A3P3VNW7_9GAMM|nr:23S rRNA (uridine(2552)-2'-O)-methyltransferase RlmE [Aestuariirhabdus litorea]RRJ83346.1 23S rRNA (uridine(2552)-2'-O)-methyltransferase RlmE [Aestuariirhabdus litorea]RWW93505.1 23S rRNA (uridine(2552)-2'-O)-methyltransferase RlmE [Endozoicomonadaceae bacterium GTF-13]